MRSACRYGFIAILLISLTPNAALAEQLFFAGEVGEAELHPAGYDSADAQVLIAGYYANKYSIYVSLYNIDDIPLLNDPMTYRRLDIYGLHLSREFNILGPINIELSYGRAWWDAEDFTNNVSVNNKSDSGAVVEAQAFINVGQWRLYGGRKEIDEVSGLDVEMAVAGARYTFK